uniref:DUF295 domain-containing protein n=1 Tax=Oryza nivara TaxID=4536 RepID=A0A0E0HH50_ORYNI
MVKHIAITRDWTNLGEGPAGLASDVTFRAVCRPWRLCCADPRAQGVLDRRFHPRRWITLRGMHPHLPVPPLPPERHHRPLQARTWISRSSAATTCSARPPRDSSSSSTPPPTSSAADLPPATNLLNRRTVEEQPYRLRSLRTVSGAGLADERTFAVQFGSTRTIAVVKPGDVDWTVVDRGAHFMPTMSFAGRFYCATIDAVSWWWRLVHRGWPLSPIWLGRFPR